MTKQNMQFSENKEKCTIYIMTKQKERGCTQMPVAKKERTGYKCPRQRKKDPENSHVVFCHNKSTAFFLTFSCVWILF